MAGEFNAVTGRHVNSSWPAGVREKAMEGHDGSLAPMPSAALL
jgi:hypothetical protein